MLKAMCLGNFTEEESSLDKMNDIIKKIVIDLKKIENGKLKAEN